jgi:hypothetical protein
MTRTNASKLTVSAIIAMGLFVAVSSAHAGALGFPGSICQPQPNQTALAGYSVPFGIHNISSGDQLPVVCGASLLNNSSTSVNGVTLTLFDRSQLGAFSFCSLQLFNSNGGIIRDIPFTPPDTNSPNSFTAFVPVSPTATFVASFALTCSIPAQTANGFSHLAHIKISTP